MISSAIWKSYKKEKQRACSEFEFRFLPGGEKTKNDNESPISFFCCREKRKTKNENKICVSFSYTIENCFEKTVGTKVHGLIRVLEFLFFPAGKK